MGNRPAFYLSKWYFDLISKEGKVFIGYSANLQWKSFTFSYSSFLIHSNGKTKSKVTWRNQPSPYIENNSIVWRSPNLNVETNWIAANNSVCKNLLSSDIGYINWDCICPKCEGIVKIENENIFGLGYVEHLEMTIMPWHLPFNELRWGRFISDNNYLVWIDWRGERNDKWIFSNNGQLNNCNITDEVVSSPDLTLQLTKVATLREGSLLSTAFNRTPKYFSIFPKHIFKSYECKWLSKGILTDNNCVEEGWSIHEVVRWK